MWRESGGGEREAPPVAGVQDTEEEGSFIHDTGVVTQTGAGAM